MNLLYALIRRFEGLRLRAYRCPAGVWTCGYGSTGPDIGPNTVWTLEQAEARMKADVAMFVAGVRRLCPTLSGKRLLAVADFAYNLGLTRFKASTLRKKLLARDWKGAAAELRKWIRGGGRVLAGLVLRREEECKLLLAEDA